MEAAKPPPYKPSPHGEGGTASAALGCFRMQHKCTSLSLYNHLSFMLCLPYPPLRGAFLQRGRLLS